MKTYSKPEFYVTEFQSNSHVAGCALNIVSGTNTVKIYCAITSYVTVFTEALSCAYKIGAFTSTSAATSFFSNLFQWGSDLAEGSATNVTTTSSWTDAQRETANSEINNGTTLLEGTIDLGGYSSNNNNGGHGHGGTTVHAGYALDYLNGFEEGKALS